MELKLTREDFINQYPPSNFLNKRDKEYMWQKERYNLYIHIPFCQEKCDFCYYKTQILGDKPVPDEYIQALLKEIEMVSVLPQVQRKMASSVYFGGGTPTKLSVEQMKLILDKIFECFHLATDYELCFEARPGVETTAEKLEFLKEYNITRLSLGVQSLDDEVLKVNGRHHDAETFYQTFDLAKKIGIKRINTDLMSGLVNQSMESWMDTLSKIVQLKPDNISVYKLELYLNNLLYKKLRKQEISLISDEEEIDLVRAGFQYLIDSGYQAANNYSFNATSESDHVHRRKIWEGEDMLGLGASAHSCYNNFLYQNELNLSKYVKQITKDNLPVMRAYHYSVREKMIQRIIFGLKLLKLDRERFETEFGVDPLFIFKEEFRLLERKGFIEITENVISVTFEGMLFADDIARVFYLPNQKNAYLSHVSRANNVVV